jgi:hypothetical protein
VVDSGGRLVGLVTPETIGEMLMLHEALLQGVRLRQRSQPGRLIGYPSATQPSAFVGGGPSAAIAACRSSTFQNPDFRNRELRDADVR